MAGLAVLNEEALKEAIKDSLDELLETCPWHRGFVRIMPEDIARDLAPIIWKKLCEDSHEAEA